jgi:hypothetical protein
VFAFHIKDLGSGNAINDQGTSVCNVGDNAGPGNATGSFPNDALSSDGWTTASPYGAVPWATDGSQDTVQFQDIYERFRHPECHEYLFERDGMSNTVTSNAYWRKLYVQAFDMYDKLVLDRTPGTIRTPFPVPSTDAEWLATDWSPKSSPYDLEQYRPAVGEGAPGAECPPELKGGYADGKANVGDKLKVEHGDGGDTWGRFEKKDDDTVSYLWLRDGGPLPQYNGAPIGSKPECECDAMSSKEYVILPEDAGHWISCQVTALNVSDDAATSVVTDAVYVRVNNDTQILADLNALNSQIAGMGLDKGTTNELSNKVDEAIKRVERGEVPCKQLDQLAETVARKAGEKKPKISSAQAASLTSSINHISGEYTC